MHQRHMPETDALGLDYYISTGTPLQIIQSQPVHNEHMHSGTTSEATLRLSGMYRLLILINWTKLN